MSDGNLVYTAACVKEIFQQDSLSLLWLCLAFNPLCQILCKSGYTYATNKQQPQLSYFHKDKLRLNAANAHQLQSMMKIANSFRRSISMRLGLFNIKVWSDKPSAA